MDRWLSFFRKVFFSALLSAMVAGCSASPPVNPNFNSLPSPQMSTDEFLQTATSIPPANVVMTESQSPNYAAKSFLMVIEDVFTIQGRGTVVTGHIAQGTASAGDEVEIIDPQNTSIETVITGVEIFNTVTDLATAGNSVGILVRGVEAEPVQPGMLLVQAKTFSSYNEALCSTKSTGIAQETSNQPLLMLIVNVYEIRGRGTVVTGCIARGTAEVGKEAVIIGFDNEIVATAITGVEMFHTTTDRGIPGDNVGILVRGVEAELVQPGMFLAEMSSIYTYQEAISGLQ